MSGSSSTPLEREVKIQGLVSRVWEKGTGDPLIHLAGLGGLTRWTPFLDLLAEERRVIVPSLPGFPGGTGHEQLDEMLDWVSATLDLIEVAGGVGADWIGVSVGGTLAAEAAAASRACRKLVLIAPFGLFDEDEPVTDVWAQPPGSQPRLLCAREESVAYITPDSSDPIEASVLAARASEAAARLLWPTTDTGLAKRLHRIRAITLLMRGTEDCVMPRSYLDRIANSIEGATEILGIEGAGHLADLDAPERCAERVLAFLE